MNNRNRMTIDIDPSIQARLNCLASDIRCPESGLVNLALKTLLDQVALGKLDLNKHLQPSDSPRYDWTVNINIP